MGRPHSRTLVWEGVGEEASFGLRGTACKQPYREVAQRIHQSPVQDSASVFQLALEKGSANQAVRPVLAIPVHFHAVWLLSSYSGKVEELRWTIRPAKLKLLIVNHFSRTYSTVADYRDSGTELDNFHGEEKPS